MSDAFLGEIRIFAGNFAPVDWALCNGQLLPISQNTALFSVIGTRFGGDGQTTFALPNMQGCAPMNQGTGVGLTTRNVGDQVGSEAVQLLNNEMPSHAHTPVGIQQTGTSLNPAGNYWAQYPGSTHSSVKTYSPTADQMMNTEALAVMGQGQPHNNMQPYLVMNFIICINGMFPPQS